MNGYLLSVIGAVLLSSVLTAVLPNGKTSGTIKTVLKLACILIIISPVLNYIKTEKNPQKNTQNFVIQTDEEFIKYYSELRVRLSEEALSDEIYQQFSVNCSVDAKWEIKNEEIFISKAVIATSDENTEQMEKIRLYLTKKYGFEVEFE